MRDQGMRYVGAGTEGVLPPVSGPGKNEKRFLPDTPPEGRPCRLSNSKDSRDQPGAPVTPVRYRQYEDQLVLDRVNGGIGEGSKNDTAQVALDGRTDSRVLQNQVDRISQGFSTDVQRPAALALP